MDKSVENSKVNKIQKPFKKVLDVLLTILIILFFAVDLVLIYQKVYLKTFWVNGQSMYPTLNFEACDKDGNVFGKNGTHTKTMYNVEFGVMDEHDIAINSIKRFDIIVCTHKFSGDSVETTLIKRVVGLPGETIQFVQDGVNTGDVEVISSSGRNRYDTPVEDQYINTAYYPINEIVLGEDEYYVCGDNRGNSSDSRTIGAIKKEKIQGKVVAICGTCVATPSGYDSNNDRTYELSDYKYYSWPRFF